MRACMTSRGAFIRASAFIQHYMVVLCISHIGRTRIQLTPIILSHIWSLTPIINVRVLLTQKFYVPFGHTKHAFMCLFQILCADSYLFFTSVSQYSKIFQIYSTVTYTHLPKQSRLNHYCLNQFTSCTAETLPWLLRKEQKWTGCV